MIIKKNYPEKGGVGVRKRDKKKRILNGAGFSSIMPGNDVSMTSY